MLTDEVRPDIKSAHDTLDANGIGDGLSNLHFALLVCLGIIVLLAYIVNFCYN